MTHRWRSQGWLWPLFAAAVIAVAALLAVGGPGPGSSAGMAMAATGPFTPNLGPGESITVTPAQWPPVYPSTFPQAKNVGFHEFVAQCSVNQVAPTDPIVHPAAPGVSHSHTFVGADGVTAYTTTADLAASATSCSASDDHSGYWFPTMYQGAGCPAVGVMIMAPTPGCTPVLPKGVQTIYYKSGVKAYGTVRAFPPGLRFVIGDPDATQAQFAAGDGSSGWSCGSSYNNWTIPATCQPGSSLVVRYQAPSCWDGVNLDTPDHKAQMAYPVNGACPNDHPVALPMLEFKIAYPISGNLTGVRLSSGAGYSWHADFFAAWTMPTQEALVTQCVNGGGQCNARGYDQHHASRGSVLDANYQLIPGTRL